MWALVVYVVLSMVEEQETDDTTNSTVSANRQEPLSKIVDEMFDSAYNKTLEENDLPHVRWGRIDYFNVTYLTDVLSNLDAPTVTCALGDANSRAVLTVPGSEGFLYVVMPMRI